MVPHVRLARVAGLEVALRVIHDDSGIVTGRYCTTEAKAIVEEIQVKTAVVWVILVLFRPVGGRQGVEQLSVVKLRGVE